MFPPPIILEKIRASLQDIQENHVIRLLSHLKESEQSHVQAQARAALTTYPDDGDSPVDRGSGWLRGPDKVDPFLRKELNHMHQLPLKKKAQENDWVKSHKTNAPQPVASENKAKDEELGPSRIKNHKNIAGGLLVAPLPSSRSSRARTMVGSA